MKNRKKLIAIAVGLSVILSGITFTNITAATNSQNNVGVSSTSSAKDVNFDDIALSPGGNPSELNFTWYSSNSKVTPMVQIALKSDVNGNDFPVSKASSFKGTTSVGNNGFTSNKVSVNGLNESTQYVYRLGDGTNWSPTYNYNTYKTSQYSFLFAGDPQIGAGGDISKDSAGWADTLNKATKQFSDNSFMISVGDQVNNGSELNGASNELEYSGYFAPEQLKTLPIAAIAGNHETYGPGHNTHFNAPNLSDKYGAFSAEPTTGTDYYFTYGNTLYLMLNSNDMNEEEHKQFMQDAIAKNPNATWKIAVLHHSVYSSANHETDSDIIQRRNDLPPIFDSLGIDVVLDGHDHCYTRSYQMKGGQAIKDQNVDTEGRVIDPKGTVYITANSASGSKYYEIRYPGENNNYEAKKEQIHVPTFSRINVTSNSFQINTYRTDTMTETDSYTLVKSTAPQQATADVIDQINKLPNVDAVTTNDADNIKNARIAYNALSSDQQKLVTNIDKLIQDENKINDINNQAKQAADEKAASSVIGQINTIPENVSLTDELAVVNARKAYNSLSDSQKALVNNYNKLTNAENTIASLKAQAANASSQATSTSQKAPQNTANISTATGTLPKTGEFFDFNMLIAIGMVSIAGGASIILIKKKGISFKSIYDVSKKFRLLNK